MMDFPGMVYGGWMEFASWIITIFTFVVIIMFALLLLSITPEPIFFRYSRRGSYYLIKILLARIYLRFLRKQGQLLPKYNRNSNVASEYGFVTSHKEDDLEKPRKVLTKDGVDSVQVFGMDAQGNTVIARLDRRFNRSADVWLYLRLSSGAEYQLPHQPDMRVYNTAPDTFSAAGLTFEVLDSMRRWKISFNGLLRTSIKHKFRTEEDEVEDGFILSEEEQEEEEVPEVIVHVKFTFIWTPFNAPYDSLSRVDNSSIAVSMATEKWSRPFMRNLRFPATDWYDQWGQMIGSITVDTTETQNLFLRGRKERKFGTCGLKYIHRNVTIALYLTDGVTIVIKALSQKMGLTHFRTGYVLHPNGVSERIKDCNFYLHDFAEGGYFPKHFDLWLKAGSKKYAFKMIIEPSGFLAYLGNNWDSEVFVRRATICGECPGYGVLEFGYQFPSGRLTNFNSSIRHLKDQVNEGLDDSLLAVTLSDPRCCNSYLVGGKGMSLALMTSFAEGNFVVPKGICVTVFGYWEFMFSKGIVTAIDNLEAIASNQKRGNLEAECGKLVTRMSRLKIPQSIQTAIRLVLREQFGSKYGTVRLAIRSSAIGEDGEETSAAGQNETILGVKGPEQWWKALAKCWASQFSFVAVSYKRNNGLPLNEGMGVVFQEMVNAEKAGVLFTRHPVTHNPGQFMITANYGLGESVVSSIVDPDTIVINRTWQNELSIGEIVIGTKAIQIDMNDAGTGTGQNRVSQEMATRCCLSDKEILRLGKLGLRLEQAFGGPRDIEWAIEDRLDYLLQSRAITTFDRESDYLILHELDGPLLTENEILTRGNIGEVFPGATSPLTLSTVTALFDLFSQKMAARFQPKKIFPAFNYTTLGPFLSHNFMNCLQMSITGAPLTVSKRTAGTGFAVMGRDFIDQSMCDLIVHRYGKNSEIIDLLLTWPGIKEALWSNFIRDCGKVKKQFTPSLIRIISNNYAIEIYERITENFYHLREAFSLHYYISIASSILSSLMFFVLTIGVEKAGPDHFSDLNVLLGSGSGGIESAQVPEEVQKIVAAIARQSANSWRIFSAMSVEGAKNFLLDDQGEVGQLFQKFLANHGHRCIKEFDFRSTPWGVDPSVIVKTIQGSFIGGVPQEKEQKTEKSIGECMGNIRTELHLFYRMILRFLTYAARKAVGRREYAKSMAILGVKTFREAYQALAKKMVSEGRIPDTDLIYYFTHNELHQLLKYRSPRLLKKVKRRRDLHSTLSNLIFPDVCLGLPSPIQHQPINMQARAALFTLNGSPASPGVVTGRARVLTSFADAHTIRPGEILITFVTDIGWSPYFPILGGVVTELGGVISHGAVVSREYGIPCLISVINATKSFQTGDLLRLDGGLGTLQLLQSADMIEEADAEVEEDVEEAEAEVDADVAEAEAEAEVDADVEEAEAEVDAEGEEAEAEVDAEGEEAEAEVDAEGEEAEAEVNAEGEEAEAEVDAEGEEAEAEVDAEGAEAEVDAEGEEAEAEVDAEVEEADAEVPVL